MTEMPMAAGFGCDGSRECRAASRHRDCRISGACIHVAVLDGTPRSGRRVRRWWTGVDDDSEGLTNALVRR